MPFSSHLPLFLAFAVCLSLFMAVCNTGFPLCFTQPVVGGFRAGLNINQQFTLQRSGKRNHGPDSQVGIAVQQLGDKGLGNTKSLSEFHPANAALPHGRDHLFGERDNHLFGAELQVSLEFLELVREPCSRLHCFFPRPRYFSSSLVARSISFLGVFPLFFTKPCVRM